MKKICKRCGVETTGKLDIYLNQDEQRKGWTIIFVPLDDMDGKPRVAGRFLVAEEKNEFLNEIYSEGSGWTEGELATINIINNYGYMLPV